MRRTRVKNDFYPTESALTEVLLKHINLTVIPSEINFYNPNQSIKILEPCAGKRHISKVLEYEGYSVTSTDKEDCNLPDTIDFYPDFYDCSLESYWLREATKKANYDLVVDSNNKIQVNTKDCRELIYDWIITNPPYNQAEKIIPLAYKYAKRGIAMLLRLSYLEPTRGRADFLKNTPLTKLIILNPRPKFRYDTTNTDSVTSAWFIWDKLNTTGLTEIIYETNWR